MRAFFVQMVAVFCTLLCGSGYAQTPAPGSLESTLAIESVPDRIAALQKFLKTNSISEQAQTAREALATSYAQLGETQLGDNNVERAVEQFRLALANLPDKTSDSFFEETIIRVPLAVSVRGYRNEAIGLARQIEKRFAKESPRLARIGEFYLTIEAANDAIRALEAASKLAEEEATLHRALGAAYRMGLRLDDAVAEYQQAITFDAKDKRAYYELANLYRAHGAFADAIKLYQKQIEIEPKHTPSYKGMAIAYLSQGRDTEAAAALNQARDIRGLAEEVTGDIYLQTQLAFHYLSKGNVKQARQSADAALYIEPRYAWARIAAAEIDMAEGKYFDAERNLLAAKNYASFPTLFFTLGKLYLAVEDFDGALEQFAKAFTYSPQKQFTTQLGGAFDVQADNLKDLLSREHQAAIFLAEPPTTDEQFKIAESLVKFNLRLRMLKMPPAVNRPPARGTSKPTPPIESQADADARRKQMEDLDQAAMGFVEAENVRRSYRMLYITGRLANAGVASGLAIELADQALGLADVATEFEGSLRDYPNYDRDGRLRIFRGRALDAKGWVLFKSNRTSEAIKVLTEAVQAYGTLPEGKRTLWHLAAAKEAEGELKQALDLYISSYEPSDNPALDVNRSVIEALYRKVNGSLNGLDKRIGPAPGLAADASETKPSAKSKASKTIAKKEPPIKPAAAMKLPSEFLAKETSEANIPPSSGLNETPPAAALIEPPVETKAAESAAERPTVNSVPLRLVNNKPVELPEIASYVERALPLIPIVNFEALYTSTIKLSFPFAQDLNAEVPPPPVHTRKRRVTAP